MALQRPYRHIGKSGILLVELLAEGVKVPKEFNEDILAMQAIFEDELRKAAFRLVDDHGGLGVLAQEICRACLRSLAATEQTKAKVSKMPLPAEVGLDAFLRLARETLDPS